MWREDGLTEWGLDAVLERPHKRPIKLFHGSPPSVVPSLLPQPATYQLTRSHVQGLDSLLGFALQQLRIEGFGHKGE